LDLVYGGIDILSKKFKLLPIKEQIYIIISSQEFLWNTMREKIQQKVIHMWELDLLDKGVIRYIPKSKSTYLIDKGCNYYQLLIGDGSTVRKEFSCGCEFLFNEIIQQFLLVCHKNECQEQEHKSTFRKIKK